MQIITELKELNLDSKTAIAMGKFDGIHLGHRKLLNMIMDQKQDGLKATVFTFEPSPEEFFLGHPVPQLFTRDEKRRAFEEIGIDILIEFPLTAQTAATDPVEFVHEILCNRLKADYIAAGTDVSFGDKGKGNQHLLKRLSQELGFELCLIDKVRIDDEEVSSTKVRNAVTDGDMHLVTRLLGYNYSVSGIIEHGHHLGHTIGVPTINVIPEDNKLLPPFGVYSSLVSIDGKTYRGMTNIGKKPTISDVEKTGVETYLYDFEGDLYGKFAKVELITFVRPEMRFASLEDLKKQITTDIGMAKNI